MKSANFDIKVIQNIFDKFQKVIPKWYDLIKISFLSEDQKTAYHEMVETKKKQLELS